MSLTIFDVFEAKNLKNPVALLPWPVFKAGIRGKDKDKWKNSSSVQIKAGETWGERKNSALPFALLEGLRIFRRTRWKKPRKKNEKSIPYK